MMFGKNKDKTKDKPKKKKKAKNPKIEKLMVRLEITGMVVVGAAIVFCLFLLYQSLPGVRVKRAVLKGNQYTAAKDYENAVASYQSAISMDSQAVTAYQNMATAYIALGDTKSAKSTLYSGWENTKDEALLSNYLTVSLNETIQEINSGAATLDTVSDVVSVLELDPDNTDALSVLKSAYTAVMNRSNDDGINVIFWDTQEDSSAYSQYQGIMEKLLKVYVKSPSDGLKTEILQYLVPSGSSAWLKLSDAAAYEKLLTQAQKDLGITAADTDPSVSFLKCVTDAQKELAVFSDIFTQMDAGTLEAARDFIVSDAYKAEKALFTDEKNGVWENTSEIPVSREGIVLSNTSAGGWTYHFMDFGENPDTKGIITIWTKAIVDADVEHIQMSYEPAETNGTYYPHTEYTISYLYSNVSVNGVLTPKMNYRLDTTVYQSEGDTTKTSVGDWGGPNEWTLDFNNLSYLSKK